MISVISLILFFLYDEVEKKGYFNYKRFFFLFYIESIKRICSSIIYDLN